MLAAAASFAVCSSFSLAALAASEVLSSLSLSLASFLPSTVLRSSILVDFSNS